jgi:tRNA (guanine37-N1)-methyltransferase
MHFDIFTLFPDMFEGPFSESILKRAQERGLLSIALHNIREATTDKHHVVDDYPYGGGAGMVMKPEPIFTAVEAVCGVLHTAARDGNTHRSARRQQRRASEDGAQARTAPGKNQGGPIILLSAQGGLFNQSIARRLAQEPRVTLICGHYEGVDERVCEHLVTEELSIGDYVLTGGELAAMVVVDAVSRLIPGVLGADESIEEESHSEYLLEYPQYTRPPEFRGWRVPDVLLSGHHGQVARWRRKESLRRTRARRPDLFAKADLGNKLDQQLLKELDEETKEGP